MRDNGLWSSLLVGVLMGTAVFLLVTAILS